MLTPNVVPDFTSLRVGVVGDMIADHYLFARPTRLSREAPVMVMRHAGEEIGAGGAGGKRERCRGDGGSEQTALRAARSTTNENPHHPLPARRIPDLVRLACDWLATA